MKNEDKINREKMDKKEIEKIKQLMRDYNFAVSVYSDIEKIFQHAKQEIYRLVKKYGGEKLKYLNKIAAELNKEEGLDIEFKDEFICAECGKTVSADKDHYHRGNNFYCSKKCASKALIKIADNYTGNRGK